jgi:hypothetical protein
LHLFTGALQRKEVDFVMTSLAVSYDRAEQVDFALAYEFSGFHLIQGRPRRRRSVFTAIFAPFQPLTWALIAVSLVLMTFAICVLEKLSGREDVSVGKTMFFLGSVIVSQVIF